MFKVGDRVIAKGNYHDEQLGQYAPTCEQTVTEVRKSTSKSGQWIRTDYKDPYLEDGWIDSAWFELSGTDKVDGEEG